MPNQIKIMCLVGKLKQIQITILVSINQKNMKRLLCYISLLLCNLWVTTTNISAQDILGSQQVYEGDKMYAPPSPTRIDGFEFSYHGFSQSAETTVGIAWNRVSFAEQYRVYRQILPHVSTIDLPEATSFILPDESIVSPYGWSLIRTLDFNNARSYMDGDIPPVDMSKPPAGRRPLEMTYCYRIEASGNGREAISPVICTRLRGINRPNMQRAMATSAEEIVINWEDTSVMTLGFTITYRQSDSGIRQTVRLVGANQTRYVLSGLLSDTEYCITIRSYDYYGSSLPGDIECVQTQKEPDAEPDDQTYTLNLQREDIYQGNIPYMGRFPTIGNLPSGVLKNVQSIASFPTLLFVKPGHNTGECNQEDAVVQLNPGDNLSAADLNTLFGSDTPTLPIVFIACAEVTPQLYNWIPINITYQKD